MKLLFLGTGAAGGVTGNPLGNPNIRRCSSTLVDGELLLDPGPHIFDFAEQYGNPDLYAGVRYILCTHSHPDHFCPETVERLIAINPDLVMYGDEAIRRKLTKLLPEVAARVNFVPLTHGVWFEFGEYRALPTHSNHSTGDPAEVTLHHTIEKDGKRLFYGLDGAWLLRESWNLMRDLEGPYHAMVFDATCGDKPDEFRVFEHNTLPMLQVMLAGMHSARFHSLTEDTILIADHLATSLHTDYDTVCERVKEMGMIVAYDGMELEF